ncbi:UNVERIFIED_CONTAM: hypothetical protein K2H54_055426 [Gekko kuhli]
MEDAGPSPQMQQEDPPNKVKTLSGAEGEFQAKVSVPHPQSCSPGSEAEVEAPQLLASFLRSLGLVDLRGRVGAAVLHGWHPSTDQPKSLSGENLLLCKNK